MGLKFKKFKAKLNWKTKETVPEVVCLRYQIRSEFEEPIGSLLATSSKINVNIGTNENIIKSKGPILKPPLQSFFGNSTTVKTKNHDNSDNNVNKTANSDNATKTHENVLKPANLPVLPAKGILKKSIFEENITEAVPIKNSFEDNNDDLKKSALIFMTENHDYSEEIVTAQTENNSETKETVDEVYSIKRKINEIIVQNVDDENAVELRKKDITHPKLIIVQKEEELTRKLNSSISSEESDQDSKTVRWRETVIEIKPNLQFDEDIKEQDFIPAEDNSTDDFKVHFVKHNNVKGTQYEEESGSENGVDAESEHSYYDNNNEAYSSQAASIFFAGEEPEPSYRVRNISQNEDSIDKP